MHKCWLLALSLLTQPCWAQAWLLQQQDEGVMLWSRPHPRGPFVELRLEMRVAATSLTLLDVLRDTEHHKRWLPESREMRLLARPSPNEDIVYTRLSAPWPLEDRELITHSQLTRTADCTLRLKVWAVPDVLVPHVGLKRIRISEGIWEAIPQPNGSTLVRLESYTDPGSNLPGWLVNPVAMRAAVRSFKAIRQLMEAKPFHPCT
ncbi:START domain-containing protein [Aeromonas veronii]|nr:MULTISPECIES: START domain-containing protein [Aeromonas]MCE9952566.1 START domain-containing protein [Aeromonas allosaccharophila]RSM27363.1 hypothetical protein C5B76_07510 [Aeromonas salmonicida]TNI82088.1 hypothetical protein CF119_17200 [Aeromonas sobria]HEH9420041.1 hypothetical protein [Aeromonas sobria]